MAALLPPLSSYTTSGDFTPFLLSDVTRTMYQLIEQEAEQRAYGATAASGSPQLPDKIQISVNARSDLMADFKGFLTDNGATRIQQWDIGIISADIPPALLGPITRHQAFRSGFTTGLYGDKMSAVLDENLTRYAAGEITAIETVAEIQGYSFEKSPLDVFYVIIHLDSPTSYDTVRAFLVDNGGSIAPPVSGKTKFYADVPVPAFDGLYRLSEVTLIRLEPPPPTNAIPPQEGSSRLAPSRGVSQVVPAQKQGAWAHGALEWQSAPYNIDGNDIKVGIIDTGFEGFNELMGNELPSDRQVHYQCRAGPIG